jgi:hypothetical protein
MVKLEVTKGRVEAQVDFRSPGRKLERLHHGVCRVAGCFVCGSDDGLCRLAQ